MLSGNQSGNVAPSLMILPDTSHAIQYVRTPVDRRAVLYPGGLVYHGVLALSEYAFFNKSTHCNWDS